jgi:peroxiredoxin Q/BCP
LRDRTGEVRDSGLEVLGVSFDPIEENRAFAEKFSFPFRLLCDVDRSVGVAYGAADDAKARFAKRISYVIGEDGRVLLAYPNVDPQEHLDRILRDLEKAG